MNLLAKLRAMSANGTATPQMWSSFKQGPRVSADLQRILALPRRQLQPSEECAQSWTARLRRPAGTMTLRPIQAAALEEAGATGGLFGMLGAGWGKVILSLLLPTVWDSRVAVLMIPPALRSKLWDFEYPELSRHWRIPNLVGHPIQYTDTKAVLHVVPYTTLSSVKHHDILECLRPDVVVCDEGHALRHSSSARSKRFRRFARSVYAGQKSARAHPSGDDGGGDRGVLRRGVRVAFLSGTFTSGALGDYAHLLNWCLGPDAPVPLDWNEIQSWGYVLDASDFPAPDGELRRLCEPGEPVRSGFRRRLVETPGVVATTDNDPGVSLVFQRPALTAPKEVLDALAKLRSTWCLPDGTPKREAIEVYAASRQLSCGFYYKTIYPRGEPLEVRREWLDARKAYFSEVRERLSLGIKGQDSFLFLWRAAAAGKWRSEHWARWAEIRKAVKPATETVWLSPFLVDAAIAWAKEAPGLVWVESEAMKAAFAVAEGAGIPVYADKDDGPALMRENGKRSVVVSINAFKEGMNLQPFNRNLVVTCPPNGALLEQTIRRTFRFGQKSDEVWVDFLQHTPELVTALADARTKSLTIEETTGQRQCLNIGAWAF